MTPLNNATRNNPSPLGIAQQPWFPKSRAFPTAQSELNNALVDLGLENYRQIYLNLAVPTLIEHSLAREEGTLAENGALVVETGKYTGRSPLDRFIVDEPSSHTTVDWNSSNQPISETQFQKVFQKVQTYLQGHDLYIFNGFIGADPAYRLGVRIINERASQNLFAHQLFRRLTDKEVLHHQTHITVIAVPGLKGDPIEDGLHSEAFILLHLAKKLILIGGTSYAGEIKKSVFTMMNYFMPQQDVLPMHGAANVDDKGKTALFFGLSGTGKTTLSADPHYRLIGDDEHGWSPTGIFNFEGGCYAKTIRLSKTDEPQIWSAIQFGSLLENVVMDADSRQLDYDNACLTENTRAAYPITHIPNMVGTGLGDHPQTILFLTADAFGVLPPVAKLTIEQAIYHFLSGYTSKLAGTERGVTTPQATFSACFGQCFFPRSPVIYGEMLGQRLKQHPETQVYWVNTGWVGGPYGIGKRIEIRYTRAIVSAALRGDLMTVEYHPHPVFKVWIPEYVPGVSSTLLNPQNLWSNPTDYDLQANLLAEKFVENFQQFTPMSTNTNSSNWRM